MTRCSTGSDISLLKKYASISKIGIVEIGALDGETTAQIASVSKVPIYSIDPIIPDSMNTNLIGNENNILNNMKFYKDFHFFRDYSYNVVKNWKYKFDFIFIDGDHKYESVKKDFYDWFSLLEIGGYLLLHDVFPNPEGFSGWPGPLKLFREIEKMKHLRIVEIVNTMPVIQKINDNDKPQKNTHNGLRIIKYNK